MKVLGIDPGLKGGLTFLSPIGNGSLKVYSIPMPTVKIGKKERLDLVKISEIIRTEKPDQGCIEKVGAMPGQGVTSMFSFGHGAGCLEGILAAFQIPYTLVIPQVWMKCVLSGLPKKEGDKSSIIWCQRFFPTVDWRKSPKSKKPCDGMTDSACIAWYAFKN